MVHIQPEIPAILEPKVLDAHIIPLGDMKAAAAETTVFNPGLSSAEAPQPLMLAVERSELPLLAIAVEGMGHPSLAAELQNGATTSAESEQTDPLIVEGLAAHQLNGLMPHIAGVDYKIEQTDGTQSIMGTVDSRHQTTPNETSVDILLRRLTIVLGARATGRLATIDSESATSPVASGLAALGFEGSEQEKAPLTAIEIVRSIPAIHKRQSRIAMDVAARSARRAARLARAFRGAHTLRSRQ